ncbi:MAG TPA: hypothetical protein DEQ47_04110 [Solibacterales bacterium]|nr:hypothetical protein [Bryobacterales bacterium]
MSTPSSSANESPESPPTAERATLLYGLTVLFSAFLLFEVQPLIAKIILPWFGGSAAVWTSCLLFFQMVLLLGYAYAHWLASKAPRSQVLWHAALLAASLLLLPIVPSPWWKPAGGDLPLLRILGLLGATVGLPYFLLSATSPLLQSWFARTGRGALPYRFFALSNAGSMAALVSYPMLVEPYISSTRQAYVWSAAYLLFAVLCAVVAWRTRRTPLLAAPAIQRVAPRQALVWIGLAAAASALLMAVTNHLSQNIAAIPFLWVLPLSLYLLSFILCFESSRWYRRPIFLGLFAVSLGSMAYCLAGTGVVSNLAVLIAVFSVSLFVCCMVCHGELARLKPPAGQLTAFYLMISIGGALGGLFVAAVAPVVFPALFEFPIAIAFTGMLVTAVLYRRPETEYWRDQWKVLWPAAAVGSIALAGYLAYNTHETVSGAEVLVRNFYGALRVTDYAANADQAATRQLTHGTINHGEQFTDAALRRQPVTYYAPTSGIGRTLLELGKYGPLRIGVVGLGAGTLAAYGRPGDYIRYYEINPLVPGIAWNQFTYLRDTPARVEIALGDARLSLERETSQQFDVLAIDAFSSDAIPVHLLTREAFRVYWRHLRPNGVLAVHVSNKYLDLAPVVRAIAVHSGMWARQVTNEADTRSDTFASDWVMVYARPGFGDLPWLNDPVAQIAVIPGLREWTDDYGNLWQILR